MELKIKQGMGYWIVYEPVPLKREKPIESARKFNDVEKLLEYVSKRVRRANEGNTGTK